MPARATSATFWPNTTAACATRWPHTMPGRARSINITAYRPTAKPSSTFSGLKARSGRRRRSSVLLVDFGREDEIAFRQTIDLVGPGLHFNLPPRKEQVRMMPFGFRDSSHLVDEIQGRAEIREGVRLREMVRVHHLPAGNLT